MARKPKHEAAMRYAAVLPCPDSTIDNSTHQWSQPVEPPVT